MGYSSEREEFVARMAKRGWGLATLRDVMRCAGIIQRAAEVDCSVRNPVQREAHERASKKAEEKLAKHAAFMEAKIETHGDPRGYCVRVFPKGLEGGEEGIGVPAQGYRAAQIERMDGGR